MGLGNQEKKYQLTNNQAYESGPNWSPDMKDLVFTSCRDGFREIYVADIDGTNLRRLTRSR